MTNPLLQDWTTPFQIAPFDQISDEDFAPAFEQALAAHRAEIDAIAGASEAPTFANTIEAMEAAGGDLDKVLSVFFSLAGADSNPARGGIAAGFFAAAGGAFIGHFGQQGAVWAYRGFVGAPG